MRFMPRSDIDVPRYTAWPRLQGYASISQPMLGPAMMFFLSSLRDVYSEHQIYLIRRTQPSSHNHYLLQRPFIAPLSDQLPVHNPMNIALAAKRKLRRFLPAFPLVPP